MGEDSDRIIRFSPFVFQADPAFWQGLSRRKLDEWKLDDSVKQITGHFFPSRAEVTPKCSLDASSFDNLPSPRALRGHVKNLNTIEEFKAADRPTLLDDLKSSILAVNRDEPFSSGVLSFLLVSFADLKTFVFYYTVAFPVLHLPTPFLHASPPTSISSEFEKHEVESIVEQLRTYNSPFFAVLRNGPKVCPVSQWEDNAYLGFLDSSNLPTAPGWLLRHLLAAFCMHRVVKSVKVIGFRDEHSKGEFASRIFNVEIPENASQTLHENPSFTAGWQVSSSSSSVFKVDLKDLLDPLKIAADCVALNIKLMKWRLMPDLMPEKMTKLKFLLLGSGTLGCNVARCLVGWGVSHITFVDAGKVSYSNPARQALFTHKDAAEAKMKSVAAFERLSDVITNLTGSGVVLEIPMPGHASGLPNLDANFEKLQELISTHDVVCMLTDSRESRYLPSVMVAANTTENPPLGMTVALGYDSFVVMTQTYKDAKAACYFCNDVTAPMDSLSNRSVDRQCTVTRPGLSGMASGIAVEVIASLSQHPDGFACRTRSDRSPLGKMPTLLRGYIADFQVFCLESEPFNNCVCCSPAVIKLYQENPLGFARTVLENANILEQCSGLTNMKNDIDLAAVEWDSE
eukprot:GEMP01013600.1.p1 GENE.GEMP01013600.1~~GEMP01013600.1.p1  ORF type:complete len:628 (+),score=100.93 GEMP01013600.1:6-1889(+)